VECDAVQWRGNGPEGGLGEAGEARGRNSQTQQKRNQQHTDDIGGGIIGASYHTRQIGLVPRPAVMDTAAPEWWYAVHFSAVR